MRKKFLIKLIIFNCFLLRSSLIDAQISEFKLSDYKLPDIRRQGIDLEFYFYGNNLNTTYSLDTTDSQKSKYVNVNQNFNARYFFDINSRNYQGYQSATFSNYIGFGELESIAANTNSKDYSINSNIQSINRFYLNNKYYLSVTFEGRTEIQKSENETNPDTIYTPNHKEKYKAENFQNSVSIPFGVGKGRIEPITDARHALYILNELKNAGKLTREPSHEEILEFSSRISEIKNERVLDSRIKKIYELNMIDSVLRKMNILESNDMVYFSTLNDMWDYGGTQQRSSGYRIELRYKPNYTFNNFESINYYPYQSESSFNYNSFNQSFILSFAWNKPISQKLQRNLYTEVEYFIQSNNGEKRDGIKGGVIYDFGIYPNTRTSFNFGLNFGTSNAHQTENDDPLNIVDYSFSPYLYLNYYFSPKLRLNLNLNTRYSFNKRDSIGDPYYRMAYQWNNSLLIRIIYSIF